MTKEGVLERPIFNLTTLNECSNYRTADSPAQISHAGLLARLSDIDLTQRPIKSPFILGVNPLGFTGCFSKAILCFLWSWGRVNVHHVPASVLLDRLDNVFTTSVLFWRYAVHHYRNASS